MKVRKLFQRFIGIRFVDDIYAIVDNVDSCSLLAQGEAVGEGVGTNNEDEPVSVVRLRSS